MTRPIFEVWPTLAFKAPFADLGAFRTPVRELDDVAQAVGGARGILYEKRDDQTSPIYGGNKVRTLEVLFGHALAQGATRVYSTGAYGSNHAAAAAFHAPRVGLEAGIILYPQPHSPSALANLEAILSHRPPVCDLPHWSALPYGMIRTALACRRSGVRAYVMEPGGAVPLGALGYVSAGIELAQQVASGAAPEPRTVVVAMGSNCTTAGLLVGFALAQRREIGFRRVPRLMGVRVTPWPVTSAWRVLRLASQTSELLAKLTGDPSLALAPAALRPAFQLETSYIGPGYGFATGAGRDAMRLWERHAGHDLETTYSAKAAAAALDLIRRHTPGPILYWATKSSAPMPPIAPETLTWAPRRMQRWMAKARS